MTSEMKKAYFKAQARAETAALNICHSLGCIEIGRELPANWGDTGTMNSFAERLEELLSEIENYEAYVTADGYESVMARRELRGPVEKQEPELEQNANKFLATPPTSTRIEKLWFTVRLENILKKVCGCETIEDILMHFQRKGDIRKTRGMGKTCAEELVSKMHACGYKFRWE